MVIKHRRSAHSQGRKIENGLWPNRSIVKRLKWLLRFLIWVRLGGLLIVSLSTFFLLSRKNWQERQGEKEVVRNEAVLLAGHGTVISGPIKLVDLPGFKG
ncbi:hypothetical protein AVEN_69386-1 [Araneus ventricosus]|uniref:Uncharacterized protein n=1 Tax=Araneus ventricosus TaxID=182803 RepID=A0A4Y2U7N2_ARAVE|nr:hypothetical protein AVEN_235543-1 [Araneus ventricosus]GBO07710.1 hypothetical protein AVEN_69386-1 [Araneus ventricosus]